MSRRFLHETSFLLGPISLRAINGQQILKGTLQFPGDHRLSNCSVPSCISSLNFFHDTQIEISQKFTKSVTVDQVDSRRSV